MILKEPDHFSYHYIKFHNHLLLLFTIYQKQITQKFKSFIYHLYLFQNDMQEF